MSNLLETFQKEMIKATKEGKDFRKNILKFVISEARALELKNNKPLTDEQIYKLIEKTIEKNNDFANYLSSNDQRYKQLDEESRVLKEFLPKTLPLEEVLSLLRNVEQDIKSAKAEGPATGIAVKYFKSNPQHCVDNATVVQAVKLIRS